MITVFLPSYAFRGAPAPFLWVFYKFLTTASEPIHFIIGEDYLRINSDNSPDRWEFLESSLTRLGYQLPTESSLSRHIFSFLSDEPFNTVLTECQQNPKSAFRRFLTELIEPLVAELDDIISSAGAQSEAIITWCNCPSLTASAQKSGIRVIHLELGPLRSPDYRPTCYFDFSGVNGGTEAEHRYLAVKEALNTPVATEELLEFFRTGPRQVLNQEAETPLSLGVALQVEDDSNLIAFASDFDNRSLISYAQAHYKSVPLLVRAHPGSLFELKELGFTADRSPDSIAFIQKCSEILTINSSVGLEALIQQKKVTALGDTSYKFITETNDDQERRERLTFYLFCYLVPEQLAFELDYIRFRLNTHDEFIIAARHLAVYRPHSIDLSSLDRHTQLGTLLTCEVREHNMENVQLRLQQQAWDLEQKVLQLTDENSHLVDEKARIAHEYLKLQLDMDALQQSNLELARHNQSLHSEKNKLNESIQNFNSQVHELQSRLYITDVHVNELLDSTSWKISRPIRLIGLQVHRGRLLQQAYKAALHKFGSLETIGKKAITVYKREGFNGVRARLKYLLEQRHISVASSTAHPKLAIDKTINRHEISVDIIVCVHNAPIDVKNCLESVSSFTLPPYRLIIVDDGSAEETKSYLAKYARTQGCILHRNEVAGGYTKAANCGFRLSDAEFVVLLNSDTIVSPYWLERLIRCGYSDPKIGIVGPLSNTASWQSVPKIFDENGDWTDNPIAGRLSIEDYANEVARESLEIYPRVGFVNGFCFAIKRGLINDIGIFDEVTFAKGYGEENDYCLRAFEAGWTLAIADDTYVFHAQSKSYSHERRIALAKAAGENLAQKHGQLLIDQRLNTTANHPALAFVRDRTSQIPKKIETRSKLNEFSGKRVLFLLPARTAGGGGNVVLLEAKRLRQAGVDAHILNLHSNKDEFEANHPYNTVPTHYVYTLEEIPSIAKHFDAIIATLYLTVEWLQLIERLSDVPKIAYYVQDFEPNFFPEGCAEYNRALASYTLLPNMTILTKTRWNQQQLLSKTGVESHVIGASYDDNSFSPSSEQRIGGQPVVVTAMVRPNTPRRAPELTMRVLKKLSEKHRSNITIKVFGVDSSDPQYQQLDIGFEHQCLGELNAQQMSELLRSTDVFLDYSSFQAMGLTAMEAMASGAVVIGPLNGGLPEIISHDLDGLLVDTSDETACFKAADELIQNPGKIIALQKNSVKVASVDPNESALKMLEAIFGEKDE